MNATTVLRLSLAALVVLYLAWFRHEPVALVVFALPVALLFAWSWRNRPLAGFWAAVLALMLFSHGVMVAWTRPTERVFAWAELLLGIAVVFSASLPGMRLRFAKKRGA